MRTAGSVFAVRIVRPERGSGEAYWTGKSTRGKYIWSDRWGAHLYASEKLARRQWMKLAQHLEDHAAVGEQLHLDKHPSRIDFLRDPIGTRTTLCAISLGKEAHR